MIDAYFCCRGNLKGTKPPLFLKAVLHFLGVFLLTVCAAFVHVSPAYALSFTVDSLSDVSSVVADGDCNNGGVCTLREAIIEIEAGSDDWNTIDFDPSLSGTISLTYGGLSAVTKNLTINGPGSDVITVDALGQCPLFKIFNASASRSLTIQGLTLKGGAASESGGAIMVYENQGAFVTGVVFTGNTAAIGGAIFSGPTTVVEISRCRFSDNSAASSGGAVAIQGVILVDQTLFVNNTAASGTGGALFANGSAPSVDLARSVLENNSAVSGGAVYAAVGSGLINIVNSSIVGNTASGGGGGLVVWGSGGRAGIREATIANNAAGADGGGIYVTDTPSSFVVVNSTISGNRAGMNGGGIYNGSFPLQLSNVTINGNVADTDADGAGTGGGIYGGGSFILENTVVAGNFDLNAGFNNPDCWAVVTSRGYNLIGDGTGCTIIGGTGDQFSLDPLLETLTWNGGYARTMLPLWNGSSGSPLVEAGNPSGCTYDNNGDGNSTQPLTTDQRGLHRPEDADGIDGARCDIGAVELDHCDNGISDVDETGVDCGGSLCAACDCAGTDLASVDGTTYAALQGAYDATWDGARIKARETDTGEILTFDRPAYISLIGGHDCSFLRVKGMTAVSQLTVSAGRLTLENIAVGP